MAMVGFARLAGTAAAGISLNSSIFAGPGSVEIAPPFRPRKTRVRCTQRGRHAAEREFPIWWIDAALDPPYGRKQKPGEGFPRASSAKRAN